MSGPFSNSIESVSSYFCIMILMRFRACILHLTSSQLQSKKTSFSASLFSKASIDSTGLNWMLYWSASSSNYLTYKYILGITLVFLFLHLLFSFELFKEVVKLSNFSIRYILSYLTSMSAPVIIYLNLSANLV